MDWDKIGSFDRHPKLNDLLKEVGSKAKVQFMDEGKDVTAEVLQSALKKSGQKGIKARDTIVFLVQDAKGTKYEFWVGAKSYSVLSGIKGLLDANNKITGQKGTIERVSKDNPDEASFKVSA